MATQDDRRSSLRRTAAVILLLSVISSGGRIRAVQAPIVPQEYRLKAAFVSRFPQFIEWPTSVWAAASDVRLCIAHPNPFGNDLNALVSGESLNGRAFSVQEVTAATGVAGCHVLFVGSRVQGSAAFLKAANGQPVLTVGDGDRFLEEGGIVRLRIVERRVRFDVSTANAQRAGLRLSSQLLGLALEVREGPS